MSDSVKDLDSLLLSRWAEAVALRESLDQLEKRLNERLETAADELRAWAESHGYVVTGVEKKYAEIRVARSAWLDKKGEPLVFFVVGGIMPLGFRSVQDENPYVWLYAHGLSKKQQIAFRDELTHRIKDKPGDWLNDEACDRYQPAGRYITTHTDKERLEFAVSPQAIAAFAKTHLEEVFPLADAVEAAFKASKE